MILKLVFSVPKQSFWAVFCALCLLQCRGGTCPGVKHSALPPKRGEDAGAGYWLIHELHLERQWAIDRRTVGELEIRGKALCLHLEGCCSSPAGWTPKGCNAEKRKKTFGEVSRLQHSSNRDTVFVSVARLLSLISLILFHQLSLCLHHATVFCKQRLILGPIINFKWTKERKQSLHFCPSKADTKVSQRCIFCHQAQAHRKWRSDCLLCCVILPFLIRILPGMAHLR